MAWLFTFCRPILHPYRVAAGCPSAYCNFVSFIWGSGMVNMNRRQFFKVTGTTLASSSLTLLGAAPTPAMAEVRQYKLARMTETRNTCPYCSRSEEPTSELQSLMRISYAVFC